MLGLSINNNFDFKDHISNIRKTANQKLIAIFRVSASMNSDKCSLPINSFLESHFTYCQLTWLFCNHKNMKNVNQIQRCYLRLITNNYKRSYGELLDLINNMSPHQRCLNSLLTEVYKHLN